MYGYDKGYEYGYNLAMGIAGAIAIIFIIVLIISLTASIISIIANWKIYKKAGKGGWESIIPVYNIIVLLQIAELPLWYLVLFIIPFANIYATFKIYIELSHKFGKSTGFGVLTVFFPYICLPIIGFSKNCIYNNNSNNINKNQNNINLENNNMQQPITQNHEISNEMNITEDMFEFKPQQSIQTSEQINNVELPQTNQVSTEQANQQIPNIIPNIVEPSQPETLNVIPTINETTQIEQPKQINIVELPQTNQVSTEQANQQTSNNIPKFITEPQPSQNIENPTNNQNM